MKKTFTFIIVIMLLFPMLTNASWWNPVSWFTVISDFMHPKVITKIVYVQASSSVPVVASSASSSSSISSSSNVTSAAKVSDTKKQTSSVSMELKASPSKVQSVTVDSQTVVIPPPIPVQPPVVQPVIVPQVVVPTSNTLSSYDEKSFVTDLGNVYYPFNANFFTYFNRVVEYANKNSALDAKGWLPNAQTYLSTARDSAKALKSKYPHLTTDDFMALNALSSGLDKLYLAVNAYNSYANQNSSQGAVALSDSQVDQINLNVDTANIYMQDVHDFLTLNK